MGATLERADKPSLPARPDEPSWALTRRGEQILFLVDGRTIPLSDQKARKLIKDLNKVLAVDELG